MTVIVKGINLLSRGMIDYKNGHWGVDRRLEGGGGGGREVEEERRWRRVWRE